MTGCRPPQGRATKRDEQSFSCARQSTSLAFCRNSRGTPVSIRTGATSSVVPRKGEARNLKIESWP